MVSVFWAPILATRLTVFPVAVQGAEAPGEISSALALANALTDELGLQALIASWPGRWLSGGPAGIQRRIRCQSHFCQRATRRLGGRS